MASSLQASCTVLATNPKHRISPFPRVRAFSGKPSHSHLFDISCKGGDEQKEKEKKVDRRNMLLGMGGMYGAAASLISDPKAKADPVSPDFSYCTPAYDGRTGDELFVECCEATAAPITQYQLPAFQQVRHRRAAQNVKDDREYVAKYNEAIRRMKYLDIIDPSDPRGFTQQANVHCAYCNGPHNQEGHSDTDFMVHGSWLFFPFHRWYLYFYERILGSLIEDDTFALPFWNWDSPAGMQMPEIYDNPCSSLYDPKRNQAHRRPTVIDLTGNDSTDSDDQKISNNCTIMYTQMIGGVGNVYDFMGKEYVAGGKPGGGGTVESGCHTSVHRWTGDPREKYHENMGNFYSAGRDPIFYSLHANVDRLWSLYAADPSHQTIDKTDFTESSFLFYNENKNLVRVKVGDSLDHTKMGYDFEAVDIPWYNCPPPRSVAPPKIEDLSKGAQTPDKLFPLTLNQTTRVLVPKTTKGKAHEMLVLEDVRSDPTKYVKFDVYIDDEDDEPQNLNKAGYAGAFGQLPHQAMAHQTGATVTFNLTKLYENIDIADDDAVVVTIIPRVNGQGVTIGGIKIVEVPPS